MNVWKTQERHGRHCSSALQTDSCLSVISWQKEALGTKDD